MKVEESEGEEEMGEEEEMREGGDAKWVGDILICLSSW